MFLRIMFLICLVLGAFPAAAAGQAVPDIPKASLDAFPEETREQIVQLLDRLRQKPDEAQLAGELGMLLHGNGHLSTAEQFYRTAVFHASGEFRWWYLLGVVLDASNQAEPALEAYNKAYQLDSGYVPLLLRLAELAMSSGSFDRAEGHYRAVLDRHPDLAVAHFGLGRVFQQTGKGGEALTHLQRAAELHPSYGAVHYALAQELQRVGRAEESRRHLEMYQRHRLTRAVVGDGVLSEVEALKVGSSLALELLKKGVEAGDRGDHQEAIRLNQAALELEPELLQASVNLVILLGREGRMDELDSVCRSAAERHPAADDLHYNCGVAWFQKERFEAGKAAFARALQINPLHPEAHNNFGMILTLEARFAEAERHYRSALEVRPGYRVARFNLGRVLLAQDRPLEAIAEFEQLKEPVDEETPRYLYALAAAMVRRGDLAAARTTTEEALELARRFGQSDLVQALERDLNRLPKVAP
jgi:tetratricopeptide (TPR) repeat protein